MQRSEITLKEVGIEMTNTVSSQPLSSYISHKLISKRPIRLSSISMPVDDHGGFIPQYRFCHKRLSSHKAPIIPKTISAENQRYPPENTAASSSSPIRGRPSLTTPSHPKIQHLLLLYGLPTSSVDEGQDIVRQANGESGPLS